MTAASPRPRKRSTKLRSAFAITPSPVIAVAGPGVVAPLEPDTADTVVGDAAEIEIALGIDAADTFIYIRAYPSKEERDRRLKAARSDPEFDQVVLQQERDPNARLIVKAHNIDMTPSGKYTAITVVP